MALSMEGTAPSKCFQNKGTKSPRKTSRCTTRVPRLVSSRSRVLSLVKRNSASILPRQCKDRAEVNAVTLGAKLAIVSMIHGMTWHFIFFKELYDSLGIYNRSQPTIPLGLTSMLIQGVILAYLYPHFCKRPSTPFNFRWLAQALVWFTEKTQKPDLSWVRKERRAGAAFKIKEDHSLDQIFSHWPCACR